MRKARIQAVNRAVLKMFAKAINEALYEDYMYEAGKILDERELDLGWALMRKVKIALHMGDVQTKTPTSAAYGDLNEKIKAIISEEKG